MRKNILLIVLFILSITLISADPPVTTVQYFPEGYTIVDTQNNELKLGKDFLYTVFVYNSSSGKILNDMEVNNCRFFLSDSQGYNIYAANMTYQSWGGWTIEVLSGNFSYIGTYNYGANCMNHLGGSLHGTLRVTQGGVADSNNIAFYVLVLVLGYVLNLLGFFKRNATITILGGIVLTFVGFFMLNNGIIIFNNSLTLTISYVTLFWGVGSALWAAVEEIQNNM